MSFAALNCIVIFMYSLFSSASDRAPQTVLCQLLLPIN